MSVIEAKSAPVVFPVDMLKFKVKIYTEFDAKTAEHFNKIWIFTNKNQKSLINRVEVFKSPGNIVLVNILFETSCCEKILKAFKKRAVEFIHNHAKNSCKLMVTDPLEIKYFVKVINKSFVFLDGAKDEMTKIVSLVEPC